jgi:cytoskeletal protein CcmA (bactofilin family)
MWGGNSKRRNARIDTLVGRNTQLTGDLKFTGGLHIDGHLQGNVVSDDAESVLSLSEHGRVDGEVRVPHVVLDGAVTGDVHAAERIELGPHARVNGNVFYALIEMAVGATVNGKLVHRPPNPPMLLRHDPVAGPDSAPT